MSERDDILRQVEQLTREYFQQQKQEPFVHGKTRIPLSIPSYDHLEAWEAIESILTTWVSMGKKVKEFERRFGEYLRSPNCTMVNSGSSANLLALSVLTNPLAANRIQPGDEIIGPALTFATAVYPIIQVGARPVLVDVDMASLNIDVREIEKAITKKTRAIMPVHLLGNPCAIEPIMELARKHNLLVIEDVCDSSGAEIGGRKAGTFGDLGTYSFFFTHIISTIEGGMVVANNPEYADLCSALRAFGWIRDAKNKDALIEKYNRSDKYKHLDARFLFANIGYNFKPMEIQGGFGIHQIAKLDGFVEIRRTNARLWTERLSRHAEYIHVLSEAPGTKSAWYGFPVVVKPGAPFTKNELMDFLGTRGVETRPILSGNITEQPVMEHFDHGTVGDLPNARLVHRHGFFFGNHQGIGSAEREATADYFDEFMAERT